MRLSCRDEARCWEPQNRLTAACNPSRIQASAAKLTTLLQTRRGHRIDRRVDAHIAYYCLHVLLMMHKSANGNGRGMGPIVSFFFFFERKKFQYKITSFFVTNIIIFCLNKGYWNKRNVKQTTRRFGINFFIVANKVLNSIIGAIV